MHPHIRAVLLHLRRHVGAGIVCSVGYFDPGNWTVDIQAGTTFGYRPMLFVILLSGVMAVLFQVLATRLGCVTGLDLAAHCRILFHDHPKHPRLVRYLLFYPLYILSEVAIIATDVAELLGSAIGLTFLIPALPIYACVLLTALDVFLLLLITDNSHPGRPVRPIEIIFIFLVAAVFVFFIILIIKVNPVWSQAFLGLVPSNQLFQTQPNAIYTAIGIIGATVMPHNLFLGSHFATQDRLAPRHSSSSLPSPLSFKSVLRQYFASTRVADSDSRPRSTPHGLRQNNPLSFIRAHLTHAIVDIVFSLLVIAVPINSAILILSAAVPQDPSAPSSVGIFSMYDLTLHALGKWAALIFACALLLSGQAASITATLAGQVISEGFFLWSISPFLRRVATRLLSLIPSVVIAATLGRSGLNSLLVASQVTLSVVLPFVAFPLVFLTSSKTVMSVSVPKHTLEMQHQSPMFAGPNRPHSPNIVSRSPARHEVTLDKQTDASESQPHGDTVDFSSSYMASAMAYALWLLIFVANVYGIVILFMSA